MPLSRSAALGASWSTIASPMRPPSYPSAPSTVHAGLAKPTVEVHLPDGRVLEGPRGAPLGEFTQDLAGYPETIVGGIVNGELRELTYPIEI